MKTNPNLDVLMASLVAQNVLGVKPATSGLLLGIRLSGGTEPFAILTTQGELALPLMSGVSVGFVPEDMDAALQSLTVFAQKVMSMDSADLINFPERITSLLLFAAKREANPLFRLQGVFEDQLVVGIQGEQDKVVALALSSKGQLTLKTKTKDDHVKVLAISRGPRTETVQAAPLWQGGSWRAIQVGGFPTA